MKNKTNSIISDFAKKHFKLTDQDIELFEKCFKKLKAPKGLEFREYWERYSQTFAKDIKAKGYLGSNKAWQHWWGNKIEKLHKK